MTVSPKSLLRSRAPSGTVRASLASGIKRIDRRWRLGHEGTFGQAGPLRDLYPGLYRSWARPGVQLAGRAIRCCLRLYQDCKCGRILCPNPAAGNGIFGCGDRAPKIVDKCANAHRDKNPGIEYAEIRAETPYDKGKCNFDSGYLMARAFFRSR